MEREIKFRAWDGKKMIFFRFRDLKRVDEGLFAYVNDSSGLLMCIDCDDNNHDIMQYTGLKDKNGKEIYEGDIVSYEIEGAKWIIEYEANRFYGKYLESNRKVYHDNKENKNYLQFEVIGNIYENPELLK